MPKSCCAVGCHNHNMMKDRKVSFFTFPNKDIERRDRWINAVKRVNPDGSKWQPCKDAVLCQDHFISDKPNNKDPIHPDYIPTVFVYTKTTTKEHEKRLKRYENNAKRKITFSTPVPNKKRATDEEDVWVATPLLSTPMRVISQNDLPQTPLLDVLPKTPIQTYRFLSTPLSEQQEQPTTSASGLKRPVSH